MRPVDNAVIASQVGLERLVRQMAVESLRRQSPGWQPPAEFFSERFAGLHRRELQILQRIAQGHSNREVADQLFLSINTVKTYIRTAYRKIGVTSRSQAVIWCLRHDVLAPSAAETSLLDRDYEKTGRR